MRKFTPTEVDLCKKIAEKERKPIEYGNWYADRVLVMNQKTGKGVPTPIIVLCTNKKGMSLGGIPLWQEHDCLEWLKEKFRKLRRCNDDVFEVEHLIRNGIRYKIGKTPLEALLRAVLAVMEPKP